MGWWDGEKGSRWQVVGAGQVRLEETAGYIWQRNQGHKEHKEIQEYALFTALHRTHPPVAGCLGSS